MTSFNSYVINDSQCIIHGDGQEVKINTRGRIAVTSGVSADFDLI